MDVQSRTEAETMEGRCLLGLLSLTRSSPFLMHSHFLRDGAARSGLSPSTLVINQENAS